MSKFKIDLSEPQEAEKIEEPEAETATIFRQSQVEPKKSGALVKVLKYVGIGLLAFLVIGAVGGYFYWQHLKRTPQYSLALLIDAARRGDQAQIDALIDTDAVVEDFVPQITDKAIELYGRNVPPETLAKIATAAAPMLPAVKERARTEVPGVIREKSEKFDKFPFWTIVVGAGRYLEITEEGDKAFIKSKMPDQPLDLTMKRNGDVWQVVGLKDEVLAKRIAEKIGQELIERAKKNGKVGETVGGDNLDNVLKKVKGIFK